MTWCCFIAKARSEFLAANEVWANVKRETFLPYSLERVRHARRQWEVKRPIYGRYVFVDCTPEDWGPIRRQRGVDRLLCHDATPIEIPLRLMAPELARGELRTLTADERARLKARSRWKLLSGPFEGHQAVVQLDNGRDIAVLVQLLGRELGITVAPEALIGSP